MTRQKYLLAVVMCLVSLQFLIVPGFNYIDEQREVVLAKNSKKEKESALLLLAQPLQKQLAEVNATLEDLNKLTYQTYSIDAGVLDVQKILEAAAKKNNVKINRMNWLKPEEIKSGGHAIQIAINATPADWLIFQSELESKDWFVLNKMTFFNRRSMGEKRIIGELSGILLYGVNFSVVSNNEV